MSGIDEKALRSIFDTFDDDASGSISWEELSKAMNMLGVKVSPNSAKKVLSLIDNDNNGTVEWHEFKQFFSMVQSPEDIKMLLSKCNQRFFEYKQMVETDASFGRTFLVPPSTLPLTRCDGHNGDLEHVAFLGEHGMISGSIDGDLIIWDLSEGKKRHAPQRILTDEETKKTIYSMAISRDGKLALTGAGAKASNVELWNLDTGTAQSIDGQQEAVFSCALASNQTAATGSKTGFVCIHDLPSSSSSLKWKGHEGVINSLEFQRGQSSVLCSCSSDGQVKVFDIRALGNDESATAIIEDAAASGTVYQALWRGSHEILSCGDDYCIKRWDLRKTENGPLQSYFGHTSVVRSICLSPDECFLVSGTNSGSVRVWTCDEVALIDAQISEAEGMASSIRKQRDELQDEFAAGTLDDPMELKEVQADLETVSAESNRFEKIKQERLLLGCTQAKLSLEGTAMAVAALAWKQTAKDKALVACGAQDATIRLYEVNIAQLETIESWTKD